MSNEKTKSIDILLKTFLKHIKSFLCDSLDFLNKYPTDVDEDTEIVTSDVISLHTSILYLKTAR